MFTYTASEAYITEATEKLKQSSGNFPRGGGIWSPEMELWWGIWTAFLSGEGDMNKIFSKNSNARGVAREVEVEASIWLVDNVPVM